MTMIKYRLFVVILKMTTRNCFVKCLILSSVSFTARKWKKKIERRNKEENEKDETIENFFSNVHWIQQFELTCSR